MKICPGVEQQAFETADEPFGALPVPPRRWLGFRRRRFQGLGGLAARTSAADTVSR